jgi:excisionase family DNA binding protein
MQEESHTHVLLNRQEAAESLRVSLRTLDYLVAHREINHVRIAGRVLFRPVDLEMFATRKLVVARASTGAI